MDVIGDLGLGVSGARTGLAPRRDGAVGGEHLGAPVELDGRVQEVS
jgi:hypothetical protein